MLAIAQEYGGWTATTMGAREHVYGHKLTIELGEGELTVWTDAGVGIRGDCVRMLGGDHPSVALVRRNDGLTVATLCKGGRTLGQLVGERVGVRVMDGAMRLQVDASWCDVQEVRL